MTKRLIAVLVAVVALLAALFVGVKAELVRPNMIFVPLSLPTRPRTS